MPQGMIWQDWGFFWIFGFSGGFFVLLGWGAGCIFLIIKLLAIK
jgi:hypothetical protein